LRKEGLDDDALMEALGIKNKETLLSLCGLVDSQIVDIDSIEIEASESFGAEEVFKLLHEIGLTKKEFQFIELQVRGLSMGDIVCEMDISRSSLYALKVSIRGKILCWGQS